MRDLEAATTWPSASSATPVEKSRSWALSDGHDDGAKYCSSVSDGDSSSTESLSS